MIRTREATRPDLPVLGNLFDQYRQFYRLAPDPEKASAFLGDRLTAGDSVILVATGTGEELLGFAQLYPTWCSLAAGPVYVLYDLYVAAHARRRGVARALLAAAEARARSEGKLRMSLSTAKTNLQAQSLYESLGWRRDEEFWVYNLDLK
jgi:ribosomal protein S18 acetylase RimI-like enzyme